MKNFKFNELSAAEYKKLINRPSINLDKIFKVVQPILSNIKKNGVKAAENFAKQFDGFDGDVRSDHDILADVAISTDFASLDDVGEMPYL